MLKPCQTCHQEFVGRPNKNYCSIGCRRLMESKREQWDARKNSIESYYLHNANRIGLTDVQRQTWLDKAETVKRTLGERP